MFHKIKKYTLYILAIYIILGFIIFPLLLKPQLVKFIEAQTNAKLSCKSISFNPFLCKISLNNVVLSNLKNEKIISFKRFNLDLELYSLVSGSIHFKEIALINPEIYVEYNKDKSINLLKILKENKKETTTVQSKVVLPHIIIDKAILVNGLISYKDFTLKHEFDFSLNRLNFMLKNIDTKNINSSNAQLRFHTRLADGGFFDLKSKVISLQPFISEGSVDFEASKLYTEWKYLQDKLNLEVADGKISFSAKYYFNLEDLNGTKITDFNLAFDKLRVKPKHKHKDVLNLEHGCITNANIFPMQHKIYVEAFCLNELLVKVKRKKNKEIDWTDYLKTHFNNESTKEKEKVSKSKAWELTVKTIKLENIAVDFEDKAIFPNVNTKLNKLNFYAKNATLLGEESMSYKMNLLFNNQFICDAQGDIIHKNLDIKTKIECKNFNLAYYKPYINQVAKKQFKNYNLDLNQASLDFNFNGELKSVDETNVLFLHDSNISLQQVKLSKNSTHKKLVSFNNFNINGISLDTLKQKVNISTINFNGLKLYTKRYKNRQLNIENLIQLKKSKKKSKTSYDVRVKQFLLHNASLNFKDEALIPNVTSSVDKINLDVKNIDIKAKTWLNYKLSMRINKKGTIVSQGKLQHTPLVQIGKFRLNKISLKELTPYIQEKAFVSIGDGDFSLNVKTKYAKNDSQADLRLDGSFNLSDFNAVDSRDKSVLSAFSKIDIPKFTFELFPNRFYANTIDVDNFYVDVLIDKNKKLNFSKLLKVQDNNMSTKRVGTKKERFPIKIVKVNVVEGNAKFADLSIPIEFKTNIHNIKGEIYSISNIAGETTTIDLRGEVNKYGSTKLTGSLNALNPKKYMDLTLDFKNLEMNSFSGYSASFAGYEIDGGKLFLDLGYKIDNAELHATNGIIIKKIKLGKKIEDDNVTSLPLGLVVALLEDSDGVIDINMPVEGNLNQPNFKYGALVWKTLGGLISKAVTSPFRLLGSMMGIDGDSLEYVEFEAGSIEILPTQREKLDNLAKMMIKRPKINLAFSPVYDKVLDKEAMQLVKLIDMVMRRSGVKNKKDHKSAMTISMLEEIYKESKNDNQIEKTKKELKNKYPDNKEKFNKAYLFALAKMDADLQSVTQEELETLANKRVKVSKKYLVEIKGINSQRIVKTKLKILNNSEEKLIQMSLEIKVK